MAKRAITSFHWFLAVWVGYEILWSVAGVPRLVGPMIGIAVAFAVMFDGKLPRATVPEVSRVLPVGHRPTT